MALKLYKIVDFGKNQKAICNFMLVFNSNCGSVSPYLGDVPM